MHFYKGPETAIKYNYNNIVRMIFFSKSSLSWAVNISNMMLVYATELNSVNIRINEDDIYFSIQDRSPFATTSIINNPKEYYKKIKNSQRGIHHR